MASISGLSSRKTPSREVYRYFTFPAEHYRDFLDAESQGHYFLNHIRGKFPYERLPRR